MSAVTDKESSLTMRKSFFDALWPLISERNPCDTQSKNTSEYFVPELRFDVFWAHTLLAAKGFQDYEKPIEMRCCQPEEQKQPQLPPDTVSKAVCEFDRSADIMPLDHQLHELHCEEQQRQQLVHDFVHRKHPWYIPRSIHEADFEFKEKIRGEFSSPLELNILQNIHTFQCKLLIIDAGAEVCLSNMERWLKFCRYAQLIAVVRCTLMARQLRAFGCAIITEYMGENLENTWHDELSHALHTGVNTVKELKLFKHCAQPFIFVFSHKRGMTECDTFRVMRKF